MMVFRITIEQKSPLGTPLAADTLFGHICWAMRYDDEQKLEEFLKEMKGDCPPLIISDPFPSGLFPKPELPPMKPELFSKKANELKNKCSAEGDFEHFDRIKKTNKKRWITEKQLKSLASHCSPERLMDVLLEDKDIDPTEKIFKKGLVSHNTVGRLCQEESEGGLYFSEDIFVGEKGCYYDIYVLTEKYSSEELEKLFVNAFKGGYGRDKSTGRGVFDVLEVSEYEFPDIDNANAVMLLSPCVPSQNDPIDGFWNMKVKEGKLGGHWALEHSPYKYPLLMIQSGSIFLIDSKKNPKKYYGRIIEKCHPELEKVVHYGLALGVPIRMDEWEGLNEI